ncbi:helix-turn-helix domain-containing protein [Streptomyces sp. SID3212]|uniref:helix-turn-helix domain-containing protein n=1 Tax=unclassified Streptomyces TaxID=2593676 RepID=UPI00136FDC0E|nr:helix-turn-helix domain-containing protein [Streptomyces sp. SID3212]
MLVETVFRSEDVPAADRFECWRELMSRSYAPMELHSDHAADFQVHQRLIRLGAVSVWPGEFQPLVIRRTPKLIRQSDPEVYQLTLVLKGSGRLVLDRQEAICDVYEFHSNDSSRPSETWTGQERTGIVGVEFPKTQLPLPRNRADQAIGRRMSAKEGVGALLAQFLIQLTSNTGQYAPDDGPRLGTVLTDLVAALFAHTLGTDTSPSPDTRRRTLVLRIQAFIQRHLHDPGLTPRSIAAAHHISLSHLHRLFRDEDATVASWIRRQRLERARHHLTDPALRTDPIHSVAARWGFTHPADFSRAFRTAYGLPPSDYRHQATHSTAWPQGWT